MHPVAVRCFAIAWAWFAAAWLLLPARHSLPAQTEPPHPILSIPGSGRGVSTILSTWTETQYTNNFMPRLGPRNDDFGFCPPVVTNDTGWSWSAANPNQITSIPSGTVFPAAPGYPVCTQTVTVMNGNIVPAPYSARRQRDGEVASQRLITSVAQRTPRAIRTTLAALASPGSTARGIFPITPSPFYTLQVQ